MKKISLKTIGQRSWKIYGYKRSANDNKEELLSRDTAWLDRRSNWSKRFRGENCSSLAEGNYLALERAKLLEFRGVNLSWIWRGGTSWLH